MVQLTPAIHQCRRTIETAVRRLSFAALDFVYPPACFCRGAEMDADFARFCESCDAKLRSPQKEECPRCGAPVGPYTNLLHGCGQCRKESYAFDRVIRLGVYDDAMRLACLRAKRREAVRWLRD